MSILNHINRYGLNFMLRLKLRNRNPSIISCNCIGGVMMHDLGIKFRTPTINLWFEPKHFVKYVKNLEYYNNLELCEIKNHKYNYPVGQLDDINIYFQHYSDFLTAKIKWDERKKRINYNNLFIIFVQSELCSENDLSDFLEIEYPKVVFTSDKRADEDCVYIKGFERIGYVKNLIPYINSFSGKRYYDSFDYVGWLNSNQSNDC